MASFLLPAALSILKGSSDATNQKRQFDAANRRNLFSVFQGPRADASLAASLNNTSVDTLNKGIAGSKTNFDQIRLQQLQQDRNNRKLDILSQLAGSQGGGAPQSVIPGEGGSGDGSGKPGFTASSADTLLRFLSGLGGE